MSKYVTPSSALHLKTHVLEKHPVVMLQCIVLATDFGPFKLGKKRDKSFTNSQCGKVTLLR